jgi:hypothetical protein
VTGAPAVFAPQLIKADAKKARQVVHAGQGPVALINRDQAVTVYLGADEGFDPAGQAAAVLDPLGALPVDGSSDIWALTQAGTAIVNPVPGGTGWQPSPAQAAAQILASGLPLAIAQQIALSGVPLRTLSGQVVTANAVVILAGNNNAAGPFTVTQPGYEIWLNPWINAGTPNGVLTVQLLWIDSVSGQPVRAETHDIWPASAQNGHILSGVGPTKGDRLTITLSNLTGGASIAVSYVVLQNSRVPARDDWRTFSGNGTASGIVTAGGNIQKKNLLIASISVPAASTMSRQIPYFNGICDVQFASSSATTDMFINIRDSGLTLIRQVRSDSAGNGEFRFTMPNSQCSIDLVNQNAVAKTLSAYIVIAEY